MGKVKVQVTLVRPSNSSRYHHFHIINVVPVTFLMFSLDEDWRWGPVKILLVTMSFNICPP